LTCDIIKPPSANTAVKAKSTTSNTAAIRGTYKGCSNPTSGASTKLINIASAIGTKTSRPKYNAATSSTPISRVVTVEPRTEELTRHPDPIERSSFISVLRKQRRKSIRSYNEWERDLQVEEAADDLVLSKGLGPDFADP
jgi:hypothetical protein